MDEKFFLKFELACLLLVSNIGAFSVGMMLPIMNFEVGALLTSLKVYHWIPILLGLAVFVIGFFDLIKRLNRAL